MLKEIASVTQVYLITGYTDLRLGIDGLAALIQWKMKLDPYNRALFLFCGRRHDRIKALVWDVDGFLLLYKTKLTTDFFRVLWYSVCKQKQSEEAMEQQEFFIKEAIRTPEMELRVRAVFAENTALHEELTALKGELSELKERLAWYEKQVYGQKSEKSEVVFENAEQLSLFDEAETKTESAPKAPETTEVRAHKRVKRTRDEIYADLEVEEVYHEVKNKTCDKCGSEMVVIGKEKSVMSLSMSGPVTISAVILRRL